MAAICTEEELNILINDFRLNKIAQFKIYKNDSDIVIDKIYCSQLNQKDQMTSMQVLYYSSDRNLLMLKSLNKFKEEFINNNVSNVNIGYTTINCGLMSKILANKTTYNVDKIDNKDSNSNIKDLLKDYFEKNNLMDKTIDDIYVKLSSKKYNSITYKELLDKITK